MAGSKCKGVALVLLLPCLPKLLAFLCQQLHISSVCVCVLPPVHDMCCLRPCTQTDTCFYMCYTCFVTQNTHMPLTQCNTLAHTCTTSNLCLHRMLLQTALFNKACELEPAGGGTPMEGGCAHPGDVLLSLLASVDITQESYSKHLAPLFDKARF